jgi:hypothetical protein
MFVSGGRFIILCPEAVNPLYEKLLKNQKLVGPYSKEVSSKLLFFLGFSKAPTKQHPVGEAGL